ncbi:MAG TPA: UbiA-like polyprenyltransferase [Capsulimonadaceae bacterium]|nr:UbiA-like polyprenyltransferase [Capsulimonadaceae bacterium]
MSTIAAAGPLTRFLRKTRVILEMIKFEHTVFALPFALMAAFVAAHGMPEYRILGWILVAMIGARSAAMAFNRIVDARYDALNPRTKNRAIPAGLLTIPQVAIFTLIAAALLVVAAWQLNPPALALSPVALLIALGYSYTKRFTALSHLFLGLALAIAPMGAWIAVTGRFDAAPAYLAGAVLFWLFGFDIIYALQDTDFDRKTGLHSIPAALGNAEALLISRLGHAVMIGLLVMFGLAAHLHWLYFAGVLLTAALVIYEQALVKPNDLSRLDFAFFNLNGYISLGLFLFTLADALLWKR